jgi:hypothetical protein
MVMCPTCGNAGCNGGSGTVNGESCPDCKASHDYDHSMYDPRWLGPEGQKHPCSPKDPAGYPAWEEEMRLLMIEKQKETK